MPRSSQSKPEPPRMTWGKAAPILVVAGITDALKFMSEWLVFFGPAVAGLYCTVKAGGSATAGAVCTAAAGAVGFFGAEITEPLGIIMAMVIAFAGWLIVGFWILVKNLRLLKANATGNLWLVGSLALGLIPFLDTFPFLTGTLAKLYHTQIKTEEAEHKKWEQETAAARKREQERAAMAAAQARMQVEAANDAQYQQEAANDAQYAQEEAA